MTCNTPLKPNHYKTRNDRQRAPTRSETVPSFVLLDVQEGLLTIYVYELLPSAAGDGEFELKVQELKHKKE